MHPDALTKKNKIILAYLPQFKGFYLAGGTALALQIGHRQSVDFDLFSPKEIPAGLLKKAENYFKSTAVKPVVNDHGELTVLVNDVKVTFLYYPFPRKLKLAVFRKLPLMAVKEIAAAKAYALGRRGTYKDYIDLYFVIAGGYASLAGIIKLAAKKYRSAFNTRLFLEQLIYLDDIKDTNILFLKKKADKKELVAFFRKQIDRLKL